jgi:maltooligosyltrehalose trehalohydrolase
MIFMGEEFASSSPFLFFCDFHAELGKLVREGRRSEFARFPEFQDPLRRDAIPDPTEEATFVRSRLKWGECERGDGAEWLGIYRELLSIRHREIVPRLARIAGNSGGYVVLGPSAIEACWTLGDGSQLNLMANLSAEEIQVQPPGGRCLFATHSPCEVLGPWAVIWSLGSGMNPLRSQ